MVDVGHAGETRQQRKLAYYRVLAQEEPDFGRGLSDLCRRLDAILAPFDRNSVRWELLDATHAGIPADQIRAFRAIVADCEEQARAASAEEATRWREQAELPRRFAELLEVVERYRVRWRLPEDSTVDIVGAYLSGEERLVPPEPAQMPALEPFIRLEPPPQSFFLQGVDAKAPPTNAPTAWAIPYDPMPPVADTRSMLEARLERLFEYLRQQAFQEAERIEDELRDPRGGAGSRSEEDADLAAGARLLYLMAHQSSAAELEDPANREIASAWAADLGITLPKRRQ